MTERGGGGGYCIRFSVLVIILIFSWYFKVYTMLFVKRVKLGK
jgi:hypothetical protein